ncbi:MAG: hypothetical protein GY714_13805 [Desulfobacterales bacterium]|nr:hypothetical protein [Desulfobacterales bacterium]
MFQRYIKLLIIVLIIFPSISFAQLNKNPKQGKKSLPDGYFMEVGGRTSLILD